MWKKKQKFQEVCYFLGCIERIKDFPYTACMRMESKTRANLLLSVKKLIMASWFDRRVSDAEASSHL